MKRIPIPENFDGNKFKEIYGDYPISKVVGFIDVDDSIESIDNCINDQKIIKERLKVAWETANAFAEEQFDSNSRASMLWIAMDPNCSEERMIKIKRIQAWWQFLWGYYGEVKGKILQGIDAKYDVTTPGNVPHDIWEISE